MRFIQRDAFPKSRSMIPFSMVLMYKPSQLQKEVCQLAGGSWQLKLFEAMYTLSKLGALARKQKATLC